MSERNFDEVLDMIVEKDTRYDRAAYHFLRRALDYTMKQDKALQSGRDKHVSGPELLDGVRKFALEQYGPMCSTLFREWGITRTRDFGEIVFNLVDYGVLGKTEEDSKEDFDNVYEFHDAFERPFLPESQKHS